MKETTHYQLVTIPDPWRRYGVKQPDEGATVLVWRKRQTSPMVMRHRAEHWRQGDLQLPAHHDDRWQIIVEPDWGTA